MTLHPLPPRSARRTPRPRTTRGHRWAATGVVLTATALAATVGTPAANAINPCDAPKPPPRCDAPPTPHQMTPAVHKVSPAFGTSGDDVDIVGYKLGTSTSVTFDGVPAAFTVDPTGVVIHTRVPTGLEWQQHNGQQVHVVVQAGPGTLGATTFSVSPTVSGAREQYYSGHDAGYRSVTNIYLGRDNGFVTGRTVVDNDSMQSLPVTVSVLFADATGKMIGYTPPYTVTAPACLPVTCKTEPTNHGGMGNEETGDFDDGADIMYPNPGAAALVHTVQVVQVRNAPDLARDLADYLALGKSVYEVVQLLAPVL